ncbi:MAG: glycosyl hydrolase 53 family protein [Cytophagales bacterium]|nr:glycosyl hydrolase 53 family protein [Cytophagales bacterium]
MRFLFLFSVTAFCGLSSCKQEETPPSLKPDFLFGADLSYVNQVLDKGGVYKSGGTPADPFQIFKQHGANLVRLRLWNNPVWTRNVYGDEGTQMYNDLSDVIRSMEKAKQQALPVLLDFHYSDTWADPGNQRIPAAWQEIRSINVLRDSVYNYTFKTLTHLKNLNLLPKYVQVGNEINCGMFFTDAPAGFPACNGCNGQWPNLRTVIKSAIQAVKDVSGEIKIMLHVADPKNVDWWFTQLTSGGEIIAFDIIGFSYYPLWHTTVQTYQISDQVAAFKSKFGKQVMILETAYPWTTGGNDNYTNLFGSQAPIPGYPYTPAGQLALLKALTQEVIDGGGAGIVYWEPAWITSGLKDLWGSGSSWENNTFFDFSGELNSGIQFMLHPYTY